jgi:arylsulfatase
VNVVFIMSDQQRVDSIGPNRHPCADYPVLERLRGESLSFDRFYASAIPCVPSRQTMLTGRQEWMSRGWSNMKFNMCEDTTWMSVLREAGYRCVSVGKTHMCHAGSFHIQVPVRETFGTRGGWNHFEIVESPEPECTYFDIHATERACGALERLRGGGPFAMFLGFHAPHEPYVMPRRYMEFVRPEDVPMPAARRDDEYSTKSNAYRARVEHFRKMFGGTIDEQRTRTGIAGHHCLMKMVDDCVGRVIEKLESLRLLDNTLVVYCSDHGDLLGEHGLFNKAATFYESEIRVPFMVRFPDRYRAGERAAGFASGIDVMPTILDILDVRADLSLPGISLLPAMRQEGPARELVTCTNTRGMMVRTADQKLWVNPLDGDGEMYDLARDPMELDNLFASRDHREMRRELFERMLHCRIRDDQEISRPTEREKRLHDEVNSSYEPET